MIDWSDIGLWRWLCVSLMAVVVIDTILLVVRGHAWLF
jgi:hypothetical protein